MAGQRLRSRADSARSHRLSTAYHRKPRIHGHMAMAGPGTWP